MLGKTEAREQMVRHSLRHRPVDRVLGGEAEGDVVRGLWDGRGSQRGGVHEAHRELWIIRGQVARRRPRDRVVVGPVLVSQDVRDQGANALAAIGNADHRGTEGFWGVSRRRTASRSSSRAAARLAASGSAPVSRAVAASLKSVVPHRPNVRIRAALPTGEWPVGTASTAALRTKAVALLPDARAASPIASHSATVNPTSQNRARKDRIHSSAAGPTV